MFNNMFQNFQQINNFMKLMKGGKDPSAIFSAAGMNNPEIQKVAEQLKNGTDPKTLFYDLCKQKGINPDMILNQLK